MPLFRSDASFPCRLASVRVQCKRCGAQRWDGPGWQLQQRLAAALQAGAALGEALLPPHGADAPRAAAAKAAAAALARFQWEAAGAGAAGSGTVPPDAAAAKDSGSGSSGGDEEERGQQRGAPGLPSLAPDDLSHLVASLLSENRECGWPAWKRAFSGC